MRARRRPPKSQRCVRPCALPALNPMLGVLVRCVGHALAAIKGRCSSIRVLCVGVLSVPFVVFPLFACCMCPWAARSQQSLAVTLLLLQTPQALLRAYPHRAVRPAWPCGAPLKMGGSGVVLWSRAAHSKTQQARRPIFATSWHASDHQMVSLGTPSTLTASCALFPYRRRGCMNLTGDASAPGVRCAQAVTLNGTIMPQMMCLHRGAAAPGS